MLDVGDKEWKTKDFRALPVERPGLGLKVEHQKDLLFDHMLLVSSWGSPWSTSAETSQSAQLQHSYALWGTVEMCGRAASSGGLQALGRPTQGRRPGHGVHDHPRAVVALLQASHHGLGGDGAELVGERAVEDQDVHGEDPLANGRGVLEDETLVDEEDAAWRENKLRKTKRFLRATRKTIKIWN